MAASSSSPLIESGEITTTTKNYSSINGHPEEAPSSSSKMKSAWQGFIERNQGLITALILFVLAILNMADRYIISSVLIEVQAYFKISKSASGLLQTVYLLSFMAFSPISGYLGDRLNRKYILIASCLIWVTSVVAGSYIPSNHFAIFLVSRIVFGFSSALFETIAVPIIGDRFHDNEKSRNRAIVAYTVGPGLGGAIAYFISLVAKDIRPNDWRFSMRVTPVMTIFTLIWIIFAYIEPERHRRGGGELKPLMDDANGHHQEIKAIEPRRKTFIKDLKVIVKNKTFIFLVFSWTAGLATVGAFQWWSSTMIEYSLTYHRLPLARKAAVKKIYSLQQAVCGVIGLISPAFVTGYYKQRGKQDVDPIILAVGFFLSTFFLYIYLVTLEINAYLTMIIAIPLTISFALSWLSGFNIFLEIMHPSMRATALSSFFFILHSVGDSVSPYWVGMIAEKCIKSEHDNTINVLLGCTRLSYYPLVYLSFAAGALGLFSSLTFKKDRQNAIDFQH